MLNMMLVSRNSNNNSCMEHSFCLISFRGCWCFFFDYFIRPEWKDDDEEKKNV